MHVSTEYRTYPYYHQGQINDVIFLAATRNLHLPAIWIRATDYPRMSHLEARQLAKF